MPISILIADDHEVMRGTLRRMLGSHPDFVVVAEAGDGAEAVRLAEQRRPDVAVVDIGMKGMNGIEATAQILRGSPKTAVLIVTVYRLEQYVASAVGAGARGYLLKEFLDDDELVRAVRTLRDGGRFFSPAIAGAVPAALGATGGPA
jgi:DNA-binding NarL/FixJ family response regulator